MSQLPNNQLNSFTVKMNFVKPNLYEKQSKEENYIPIEVTVKSSIIFDKMSSEEISYLYRMACDNLRKLGYEINEKLLRNVEIHKI